MTVASRARIGLLAQLSRFALIGGFSAIVDYGIYQSLLALGIWVHLAKALSFIAGTATAYLLNRRWTFNARGGRTTAARFAASGRAAAGRAAAGRAAVGRAAAGRAAAGRAAAGRAAAEVPAR